MKTFSKTGMFPIMPPFPKHLNLQRDHYADKSGKVLIMVKLGGGGIRSKLLRSDCG